MSHPNPYEARARRKAMDEANAPVVEAKCVGCGLRRIIRAGEVPKGGHPMCHECYMPMIAVAARVDL